MIIDFLKKEIDLAIKEEEVPVASLITLDGKIISKAHNQTVKYNNPLYHAEVLAIIKAAKKLRSSNLSNCVLYTSLKPCKMCEEVIKISKIKLVYYVLESQKVPNNKIEYISMNLEDSIKTYFRKKLVSFFQSKR